MLTYAEQEVINDALIGNTHEAWITSITPGNALFRPFSASSKALLSLY
jgi:hypothetical protein